jgi:arylsulfatase A-like enzyme
MAEHFAANGYRTFAWSSNPHLGKHTNLMQGFETVEHPFDPERADASTRATAAKLLPTDRSCELGPAWEPPAWFGERTRLVPKDAGPVAADAVLDWIGREAGEPFFAFVDLMEAHAPRVPSKEAREAVADDALRAKQLTVDATQFRVLSAMEGKAAIPAQDRAVMASVYDAALWDLDRATAQLLDGLEARGLLDDTIVVITSDHGENLGERGMYEHRWDLHETLVHVPLVVRWPRGVEAGRISAPVSTQHLFGTLVRLAGLPAPAVSHALPALGEEPRVFSELVVPGARDPSIRRNLADLDPERWNRRYASVYEGDLKLLQTRLPGGELTEDLFDLAADPDERSDLSNYRRDDATRLEEALAQWRATRPRYSPELREPTDRPRRTDRIAGVDESLSALGSDGRRAAKAAKAARTGPK